MYHINKGMEDESHKTAILVDSDPDGYCSAAMLYSYIDKHNKETYPFQKTDFVEYILHTRPKAHGLSGLDDEIKIPYDVKFLIIPDAGTNDVEQCKILSDRGIEILILDHHEKEIENPYATIVNNQMSDTYTNKDLCGAGVVYRFLQALDDEYWNDYADDYLDLCALANISDVMDMRSFETRYLTDKGLKNIHNKCFKAFIEAQDYSMNGKITIHNVQWYITPLLNSCIRIGSLEEKELLFKAFIEQDECFEYKKRAVKGKPAEVIQESIYDRVARLCKNIKSRQDRQKVKSTEEIIGMIEASENVSNSSNSNGKENKVAIADVTNILDTGLTGVVAINVAEHFNKPCILLQKRKPSKKSKKDFDNTICEISSANNNEVYGGSARNVNHSPIESFKDVVNHTTVMKGQGHASAFGIVDLPVDKKEQAIEELNELLKDIEYDSTYLVDFIMNPDDVTIPFVYELSKFENLICQGIEEPMVAVEDICLNREDFEIFGKNEDTISFILNDIKYIQFKCKDGNKLYDFLQDAWSDTDYIKFTIVGKPSINEYQSVRTPQIIIEDVEVIEIGTSNELSNDLDKNVEDVNNIDDIDNWGEDDPW